jgi:biopolymer transport protein ExbD
LGVVPMTPMIDVVFQLLVYFLIAFETPDVLAYLDVYRPSTSKGGSFNGVIPVGIHEGGFTLNGHVVAEQALEEVLTKLAGYGRDQAVLITCHKNSRHDGLVTVLDFCAKAGLNNLSVVSGN